MDKKVAGDMETVEVDDIDTWWGVPKVRHPAPPALRHPALRHCGTAALWHCGTVAPEPRVPDFGNIIYDIPKVRHLEISSAGLWEHRVGYSQSPALELSR